MISDNSENSDNRSPCFVLRSHERLGTTGLGVAWTQGQGSRILANVKGPHARTFSYSYPKPFLVLL